MSKEIGDHTFKFLEEQYAFHVGEFLDDPDGMCGQDAKDIAKHYDNLVAIGEDIALAKGPKKRGSYFWKTVKKEDRSEYEIQRLKDYLKEASCSPTCKDT